MQEEALVNGEQYREYLRRKNLEQARGSIARIECDCLSSYTDRVVLRDTCRSANAISLGAVVVFPAYVKSCVTYLGKDPKVSLVAAVAYPYGEETTETKVAAVKRAVKDGADEVEVCAPMSFLKDGNLQYFKRECKKLKKAAKIRALRVTVNCGMLNKKELIKACSVAADAGVNCIRLRDADAELVGEVKAATTGKCLIKAEHADGVSAYTSFCVMGADFVGCTSALNLANFIMKKAEE